MFGLFKQVFHSSEQETIDIFEEKINVKYEDELCASFRVLSLTNSHLEDLRPLSSFKNLEILNLSYNDISNIDTLKKLKALKIIDLRFNQLKELPSWLFQLKKTLYWEREDEEKEGIFLEGNPLNKTSFAKVKKRREELKLETLLPLNTQHLTLCIPQFLNSNFLEEFVPNGKFFIHPSSKLRLNISIIEYDAYENLIFNGETREEFNYILLFLTKYEGCYYHKLLDFFTQSYPKTKLFLVLNNEDKAQFLKTNKYIENFLEIFYTSVHENSEEIRDKICQHLQNTKEAKSLWKESWIALKNEIEENDADPITLETFYTISKRYLLEEKLEEELLDYFIQIGSLKVKKERDLMTISV